MIIKPKYYGPAIPSTYAVTMTAAASGSNGITVADDNDIDFGTGDFFIHWEGSLPDWTPAATVVLMWKSAASVGYLPSIRTSGVLRLQINATVYESTVSTGLSDNASAEIDIVVTRSSAAAAGSVVFYVNGVQLGASVAIAAGVPATISNADPLYISGSPTARSASNTISCIVGNFAPTAAEVLDLCTNGIPESWKWGSQAASYTSSFAVNADSWAAVASGRTIVGNQDGINGSDNWAKVERTGATGAMSVTRAISGVTSAKYRRTTVTIYNPVGSGIAYFNAGAADAVSGDLTKQVIAVAEGTEVTATIQYYVTTETSGFFVSPSNSAGAQRTDLATGKIFYFKDYTFYKAGATLAFLPPSIPTSGATAWDDSSGNTGGGTLPAAGATKVTIRR